MPTYTDLAGTTEDTLEIGKGDSGDKSIVLNNSDVDKPTIKFNDTSKAFELDDLKCSKIELTDNVSITKGIIFADGTTQGSGSGTSLRIPIDSNDILVFRLDEEYPATTFVNTGTLGTSNNLIASGSNPTGRRNAGNIGIFNKCLWVGNDNFKYEASRIGAEPAYPITISFWLKTQDEWAPQQLFYKAYRSTLTWTEPYYSLSIRLTDISGLARVKVPVATVTIGGTRYETTPSNAYGYALTDSTMWSHLGMTYDGSLLKLYVNGDLACSSAITGAIDYSGQGAWIVGPTNGTMTQDNSGFIEDIRVATVARDADWFRRVFMRKG